VHFGRRNLLGIQGLSQDTRATAPTPGHPYWSVELSFVKDLNLPWLDFEGKQQSW